MDDGFLDMDATELSKLIKSGDMSPVEAVEVAVKRAKSVNPTINAIILDRFEEAAEDARSGRFAPDAPLSGVPYVVKDLTTPEKGERQCEGNRRLKELGYRANIDANVIVKAKAAGLISIGRTNTPEFTSGRCGATAETLAFGDTTNPWDLSRTAMGSSGGSAAAVAAGIVPFAHGTDGGGSVRLPASACGIVGLKPSRGRISIGPVLAESWNGGATHGVLAKSVRDIALGLDCFSGYMMGDHYTAPPPQTSFSEQMLEDVGRLKIGVVTNGYFDEADPQVVDAVHKTVARLESLGHTVEPASPECFFSEEAAEAYGKIIAVEIRSRIDAYRNVLGRDWTEDDMEFVSWANYVRGGEISALEYVDARLKMNDFTRNMAQWWEQDDGYDILLTPTLMTLTPKLGFLVEDVPEREARLFSTISHTWQFNISGQPAISLPLHMSDEGLPIGMQFAAAFACEGLLLKLARQLEQSDPWFARRPSFG